MFSLDRDEIRNLSQIVISSKIKHAPNVNVFTEQGVAMLSSVLNSEKAVEVNIQIVRTFVKIRELMSIHKDIYQRMNKMELKQLKQDKSISTINNVIEEMLNLPITLKRKSKSIGFKKK